ncbi:serine/threonine protein kinase [Actinacidiphila soli]|uniref:serine/threonine protein kinase n=1 Tax=Actinacidiphila soli TaxID=2487275 RepID=UPI000FCA30C2|nr:protein kinase [Actinacidiphila soli]
MDDYAGRVLAERYRLPRPPADEYELVETRAFDTYSGQEVLVRQILLPEVVSAEPGDGGDDPGPGSDSASRALEAARAAGAIPDHPRLVQVFDIFTDGGSLWIVSELVPARPLAALLADKRLSPYRAAEIASDVLTALLALHAHGWTHRNVTAGTVLVCDDGRAMLSGLAAGAAQEALAGYNPVPVRALAGGSGGSGSWEGPDSALELERARQARMHLVGPVTERWAPEQATPVHENWQLAPPVGPTVDLWALGSLLFRSVQGHPPFPEESTAELVQLVCAEPPAYAEECGALRPIVESLLRQDPSERPDVEELRGWLRSLVRSAPEPDLGLQTVRVPADDPHKLPIVRRRGELVRKRRQAADPVPLHPSHGRHKRAKAKKRSRAPRSLGLTLLLAVVLLLVATVAYAVLFMPRNGSTNGSADTSQTVPAQVSDGKPKPSTAPATSKAPSHSPSPSATPSVPSTTVTASDLGSDFKLRTDSAGFTVAVPTGWQRQGKNSKGQVRYTGGDMELIVVPGRDSVADFGSDPLAYQSDGEAELDAFRSSAWSSAFGARSLDLNGVSAAEGEYTYRDSSNREVYATNLVMLRGSGYHVVLFVGPTAHTAELKRYFDKAAETYSTSS